MPWLGDVPAHWEIQRLKTCVANIIDPLSDGESPNIRLALENVESWTGRIRAPSNNLTFESQLKRFRAKDVLFGKLRPYLAKVARPTQNGD